ncbi:MAG: NAD(P)-dependent dehydrogenase (short-subunit alcohol dehydrogenase family) [Alphaproteobacteria bacterium]|jgi:NAD(P)-dependent dehydrogenase (short-subunit alcohol dehydrogenase family)
MPTVLITGANRGLGREFARQFRALDWRVIATCRDPAGSGLQGDVHALDVTDGASVQALAKSLAGEPIDLLLNNAGIYGPRDSDFGNIDFDAWDEVMRVNTLAPLRVAEALADNVLRSERKQMVFISSMMGSLAQTSGGDGFIYRSSKAGLNMAVKILSNHLKPRGATCVMFHPGWVRTDMGGPSAAIDPVVSVSGMMNVIKRLKPEDSGRFINYDGFDFPW